MREIITQLQPGREGGRQGSGEREGRKDGGQGESRRHWSWGVTKGWAERLWGDSWEAGRLDDGDLGTTGDSCLCGNGGGYVLFRFPGPGALPPPRTPG